MADIFISYSRADRDRIEPLAQALKSAGFSVWWDTNIHGGVSFAAEITRQLSAADVAIVAWSYDSEKSEWVLDEAAQARSENKLMPICLDNIKPPLGFRQRQAIDFEHWNGKPDTAEFTALVQSIKAMQSGDVADFEMPAPPKRISKKYIVAAALFSAAILFGFVLFSLFRGSEKVRVATNVFAISEFEVFDQSDETERFSRGLREALERIFSTNRIAVSKMPDSNDANLRVPEFVVEGSVENNGEILAVNVDVRQNTTGLTVWSGHIEAGAAQRQASEEQISRKLAEIIRCANFSRTRMNNDSTPELLALVWRYCEVFHGADRLWNQLPEITRQIVSLAPQYAESHALYAWTLARSTEGSSANIDQLRAQAHEHADKALSINPDDGRTYHALAILNEPSVSLSEREGLFLEAIKRDPDYVWSRGHYGHFLTSVGRLREAIHYYEEFSQLFPISSLNRTHRARRFAGLGDIDQARFIVAETLKNWPYEGEIRMVAASVEHWYGDPNEARQLMSHMSLEDPRRHCLNRFLDARAMSESIPLEELKQTCGERPAYGPHMYFAYFGYNDAFFDYVNENLDNFHYMNGRWSLFEGFAESVRADARFMPFANKLGLVDYWLQTNYWPDFCAMQKNLPYDCREAALEAKKSAE